MSSQSVGAGKDGRPAKIQALNQIGQSVWLDYIDRQMLESGELARLRDRGVSGVTANPTIFEKAMGHGTDYDEGFKKLAGSGDHDGRTAHGRAHQHDLPGAVVACPPRRGGDLARVVAVTGHARPEAVEVERDDAEPDGERARVRPPLAQ